MTDVRNKRVTVAGLGRFGGGIAVAKWLVEQGAKVLITDQASEADLKDSVARLGNLPVELKLGTQQAGDFMPPAADLVVASPAIPPNNPFLMAAAQSGVPVTTEIRLFVERCPATILGVTGTKGKSTTSTMLGHILRSKFKSWVGGNIGGSLLSELGNIESTDIVVLELSSYMLYHLGFMRWSPHVALLTMLASDHLEWHGSAAAYLDAKRNIVRFQRADDLAVIPASSAIARELVQGAASRIVTYGDAEARDFELKIPGAHNQLNAQGAFAAASVLGIAWEDAQAALRDFSGLPHRLQRIGDSNGVAFYNDSIATVPEAAIAALESFPRKTVIQIVGGYDNGASFIALCGALVERAKAVLCIGQTGKKIADILAQSSSQHGAMVYDCGDLQTAIGIAQRIATSGDVVLLSTGCKSYDQFKNFEERGDAFCRLVTGLHQPGLQ